MLDIHEEDIHLQKEKNALGPANSLKMGKGMDL